MIHELHVVIPPGKLDGVTPHVLDLAWHLKPSLFWEWLWAIYGALTTV